MVAYVYACMLSKSFHVAVCLLVYMVFVFVYAVKISGLQFLQICIYVTDFNSEEHHIFDLMN